jgi:hypothetical protein
MGLRRWSKKLILCVVVGIACASVSLAFLLPRRNPDDSLNRLLHATVRIAPQGEAIRGCGVIVDEANRLVVVTVADVMNNREDASIFFPHLKGEEKGSSAESGVPAKVIYRDPVRRLIILRLDSLREGAAALPLGHWPCSPGQQLHSVYSHDNCSETTQASWSFSRGRMQQTLMVPHL